MVRADPSLSGDPASGDTWAQYLPELADALSHKAVSFDQLLEAHFGSHGLPGEHVKSTGAVSNNETRPITREMYQVVYPKVLIGFREAHGDLLEIEYGAPVSGIALTKRERASRSWWRRLLRRPASRSDEYSVHLQFPTSKSVELLDLQYRCGYFQVQQYRVSNRRYVESYARALYAASGMVLQLEDPKEPGLSPAIKAAEHAMTGLQSRYDWIQSRLSRVDYMRGVFIGAASILAFFLLLALLFALIHSPPQATTVITCMAGGAIAAASNALLRLVQGTPSVQGDESRLLLGFFGALRPALGAIFALIAYALIQGGLLPVKAPTGGDTLFWFVLGVSFVAGFSEGMVPDLIQRVSAQIGAEGRA